MTTTLKNVSEIVGKTLTAVEKIGNDRIEFTLDNSGGKYALYHDQEYF